MYRTYLVVKFNTNAQGAYAFTRDFREDVLTVRNRQYFGYDHLGVIIAECSWIGHEHNASTQLGLG